MYLYGDTLAIVPYRNLARLSIDCDLNLTHVFVVLLVICCVHENLVEDLIKTRHNANVTKLHRIGRRVVCPHLVGRTLNRANVGIGSLYDVFEMGKLNQS
jgi:hypothetical protein